MLFRLFSRPPRVTPETLRRYVAAELRDARGMFQGGYHFERLPQGTDPGVFKIQWDGAPAMIIRFHRPGKEHRADHFFRMCEFVQGLGLPVPSILYTDRSRSTVKRYGAEVSLEQFIEGKPFREEHMQDAAVIRELAGLMVRFHRCVNSSAGLPWRPDAAHGREALFSDIDHYLDKAKRAQLIAWSEARSIRRWFAAWRAPLGAIRDYELIHGDLNWGNVIIGPDRSLVVIDFVQTRFGFFEYDLASSARSLVGDSPSAAERFFEEYFAQAGPAAQERWQNSSPFFNALVALQKASSNAAKCCKVEQGRKSGAQPYHEKSRRFLSALHEILDQATPSLKA